MHNISTIKLSDLYTFDEFSDEGEALYHHVQEDDFDRSFAVKEMPPEKAASLLADRGDMTVAQAYRKFASKEQKDLVKFKTKLFDKTRIVVVDGDKLVDGNHHVMAAVITKNPVKYIDLRETDS